MGACASKPKDLDIDNVPVSAPVEAPVAEVTPVAEKAEAEAETETKEVKDGDEPLVDISETEITEDKTVVEEAAKVEEAKEEKKEVAETVATA